MEATKTYKLFARDVLVVNFGIT